MIVRLSFEQLHGFRDGQPRTTVQAQTPLSWFLPPTC